MFVKKKKKNNQSFTSLQNFLESSEKLQIKVYTSQSAIYRLKENRLIAIMLYMLPFPRKSCIKHCC